MTPRFLQLHTLSPYPGTLLNRDDVGFAKRLPFGGATRLRISSQCLKRHWRLYRGQHSLHDVRIDADNTRPSMSIRSRRIFEHLVRDPLEHEDGIDPEIATAVTEALMTTVLGSREVSRTAKDNGSTVLTRQLIVLGHPEVRYLRQRAKDIAQGIDSPKAAKTAVATFFKGDEKKNLKTMTAGAGLDAALFGRMVTSDILARCDAAVHVAHAFTVHEEEVETDYFSAVDDLPAAEGAQELGSAHINTSELTSGVFYGFVVVDVPLLVSNLVGGAAENWLQSDRAIAAEVVESLVHIIAEVSPGAKLGSTAPYAHAHMVLAEVTEMQPRTIANAFLQPVSPRPDLLANTYSAIAAYVRDHQAMYEPTVRRRLAAMGPASPLRDVVGEDNIASVPNLARWLGKCVRDGVV